MSARVYHTAPPSKLKQEVTSFIEVPYTQNGSLGGLPCRDAWIRYEYSEQLNWEIVKKMALKNLLTDKLLYCYYHQSLLLKIMNHMKQATWTNVMHGLKIFLQLDYLMQVTLFIFSQVSNIDVKYRTIIFGKTAYYIIPIAIINQLYTHNYSHSKLYARFPDLYD